MKKLNSFHLKIIACISMMIDHAVYLFVPAKTPDSMFGDNPWYLLGRALGRPSFILFSFLLVEAFFYTENRKKYIIRLFILALISEPIFDYMCGRLNLTNMFDRQNVVFTFLIGIGTMLCLEAVKLKYLLSNRYAYNIISVAVILAGFGAAILFKVDYGEVGLALILIFYYLRYAKKSTLAVMLVIWSIGCIYMEHMLEWAGLTALIPICMYNGEKGKDSKWLFYVFYPLHMLLLAVIRFVIL